MTITLRWSLMTDFKHSQNCNEERHNESADVGLPSKCIKSPYMNNVGKQSERWNTGDPETRVRLPILAFNNLICRFMGLAGSFNTV